MQNLKISIFARRAHSTQNLEESASQHWLKYSPYLNPQANVWAWCEPQLRKKEKAKDTFSNFGDRVVATALSYPFASAAKLIPSMEKRCEQLVESEGAMLLK